MSLTDEQYRDVYRAQRRSSLESQERILASRIRCHAHQLMLVQDVLAEPAESETDEDEA